MRAGFKYFLNDGRGESEEVLPVADPEAGGRDQREDPEHQATVGAAIRAQLQRYSPPHPVSRLKEELHALQENYSYVGEVVKVMGKNRVLVKVTVMLRSLAMKASTLSTWTSPSRSRSSSPT